MYLPQWDSINDIDTDCNVTCSMNVYILPAPSELLALAIGKIVPTS